VLLSFGQEKVRHPFYRSDDNIDGLMHLISDFGPRRLSISKFHKGIDYQMTTIRKAYAIQCCPNLSYTADGGNSYVEIGDNWLYMHILTGSHKSLKWALDIKEVDKENTLLLETLGHDDNAKVFVLNNFDHAVGKSIKTIWGDEVTAIRKVEKGDLIFRPNSQNHLHIQNGRFPKCMDNSPLNYIPYKFDDGNVMDLELLLKYKDKNGIATN
nr:hypothetical protein [Prolixibacteraceae bacterium]